MSSLFLALLIPIVSAQWDGVYKMFSFFFGGAEGEGLILFLKAGVWIILFAIIFGASTKIFSENKGAATIFSIVFSLIAIRFIPDEYIYYIGSAYGVLGIVLLVLFIIGSTLYILNKYFPIKEHKFFGVVWALFYFFMAWVFEQLINIDTSSIPINGIDELINDVLGPWGKWICIVLGFACLIKTISGKGGYARKIEKRLPEKLKERTGKDTKVIERRIRSLSDLKHKYENWVMNIQVGGKDDHSKHIRRRKLKAMKVIIEQVRRMGCDPRREFLPKKRMGGIGNYSCRYPEEYEESLKKQNKI